MGRNADRFNVLFGAEQPYILRPCLCLTEKPLRPSSPRRRSLHSCMHPWPKQNVTNKQGGFLGAGVSQLFTLSLSQSSIINLLV